MDGGVIVLPDVHDGRSLNLLWNLSQVDLIFQFMKVLEVLFAFCQNLKKVALLKSITDGSLLADGFKLDLLA